VTELSNNLYSSSTRVQAPPEWAEAGMLSQESLSRWELACVMNAYKKQCATYTDEGSLTDNAESCAVVAATLKHAAQA
jgi:hypothetical protein